MSFCPAMAYVNLCTANIDSALIMVWNFLCQTNEIGLVKNKQKGPFEQNCIYLFCYSK